MTIKEIINDLKMQIQALENAKTMLTEQQEDIRRTISFIEFDERKDAEK